MTTHKGKKSLSDSNFQRRRRRPRFFLCGICNVVSVAAENPQPHHGTGNETDSAQERCSEEEFSKGSDEKRTEATQWTSDEDNGHVFYGSSPVSIPTNNHQLICPVFRGSQFKFERVLFTV